jgi:hypothetical protein
MLAYVVTPTAKKDNFPVMMVAASLQVINVMPSRTVLMEVMNGIVVIMAVLIISSLAIMVIALWNGINVMDTLTVLMEVMKPIAKICNVLRVQYLTAPVMEIAVRLIGLEITTVMV